MGLNWTMVTVAARSIRGWRLFRLFPGPAAEAGLLAALAGSQGMTGSLESLHGAVGYAAATSASSGNWGAALDGLGDWTPITRMTVKNHGCCGHIFPALDGLTVLIRDLALTPESISAIHVDGYGATKSMCDRPDPQSPSEARFSLQYCVAALFVLGAVRLEAFRPACLGRSDIRALMDRVSVSEDAELAAAYPQRRMARLLLRLSDGREVGLFQATRKGDPEDPLSDAELIEKFEELVSEVLLPEGVDGLKAQCLQGDDLPGAVPLQAWRPGKG
jgi:2-methylcitrate dehydratase PrpD